MESVPDEAGQPAEGVLHARRISSAAAPDAEIPGSLDFCHLYPLLGSAPPAPGIATGPIALRSIFVPDDPGVTHRRRRHARFGGARAGIVRENSLLQPE